jgi:hypothetical protein
LNDKVKCLECNKEFGVITAQHLKSCCGLTLKEYKEKHPDAETISEKVKSVRKQNCKNLIGQTKTVQCSKCGNDMETSAVNHWDFICDECRIPETYPGEVYLRDKDLVVCQICWQALEQITWMHAKKHGLTIPEYRKLYPHAYITNERIRKQRRIRNTGEGNPTKRKDVREKLSQSQLFNARSYVKKYPWIFPKIEKIRDNFGLIEVQCKLCKKWFVPTKIQLQERIRALRYGSEGQYMYCSNECKGTCPLYRLNPTHYLCSLDSEEQYTGEEYSTFRIEVLKRQRDEYGKNFCEMCESEENLQVHHEKTQKTHPHMTLDPDNGIILCKDCHISRVHVGECSAASLANKC